MEWILCGHSEGKRKEQGRGGENRRVDQGLVSDKKEVETNVGQYRFSMDAGVIGVIHNRNWLNLCHFTVDYLKGIVHTIPRKYNTKHYRQCHDRRDGHDVIVILKKGTH